jgi:formylglycine-generating enzyme required for sulfatase activity
MAYLPQQQFCIDRTEVTWGQYMAWLATNPSADGLPERCDASESYPSLRSFQPSEECLNQETVCRSGCDERPMVCVDWCDAYGYCKAVGKRLCGALGGGSTPFDQFANADVSQWFAACSSGGQFTYPYGNTFDPQACHVAERQDTACLERLECDLLNVASLPTCQPPNPPYRGIFDLLGNVMEWEDSYDAATTHCRLRGASMHPALGTDTCAFDSMSLTRGVNPHYAGWDVGFRCCLDVTL